MTMQYVDFETKPGFATLWDRKPDSVTSYPLHLDILWAVATRDPSMIENFVTRGLEGFVNDPADSDYQCGFLAALIQCADVMGIDDQAPMIAELKEQLTA